MKYRNLFDLAGKVVMITGAAGGLGQVMAEGLAEFGADIALVDYQSEGIDHVMAEIHSMGRKAEFYQADVTNKVEIEQIVEKVVTHFGAIDILINSAGVNNRKPVVDFTEAEWNQIIDINLKGTFLCCQAVGKVMLKQQQGKIINLGSVSSILGHPHHAPYAASKGGVALLTKVMAVEWAKCGINVNAICPAYIKTPLTEGYLAIEDNYEKIAKTIPMGRLGEPGDIVGAAVFLASPASDFMTGHLLLVDGGRCAD